MTFPRKLTDAQIREIMRLRQAGREYKAIARTIGCTIDQVVHYWRTSPFYPTAAREIRAERARKLQRARAAALKRLEAQKAREVTAAKAELATQVREARAEAPHADPHKRGDLVW